MSEIMNLGDVMIFGFMQSHLTRFVQVFVVVSCWDFCIGRYDIAIKFRSCNGAKQTTLILLIIYHHKNLVYAIAISLNILHLYEKQLQMEVTKKI